MIKETLIAVLSLAGFSLLSMEMEETEMVQNSTITVDISNRTSAPEWKYECCPDAYSDDCCCTVRQGMAGGGGIAVGAGLVCKGFDCLLNSCTLPYSTVGQVCHDIWSGGDSCNTAAGCICAGTRWTITGAMIAGAVSALLSVVPCVNHNGCNVWRRTRVVDGQVMTQLQESRSKANNN